MIVTSNITDITPEKDDPFWDNFAVHYDVPMNCRKKIGFGISGTDPAFVKSCRPYIVDALSKSLCGEVDDKKNLFGILIADGFPDDNWHPNTSRGINSLSQKTIAELRGLQGYKSHTIDDFKNLNITAAASEPFLARKAVHFIHTYLLSQISVNHTQTMRFRSRRRGGMTVFQTPADQIRIENPSRGSNLCIVANSRQC